MGRYQTEQPEISEKSVGPLMEVPSFGAAPTFIVKQSEPFASFHSLFQSRQHADGPNARFDPTPRRGFLSGLLSQRHCRRFVFRMLGHPASIFLEPFAPPALPGFNATMAPLTPARSVLRALGGHERRVRFHAGLSVSCARPSHHSVPTHPSRPRDRFITQPFSVTSIPPKRVWISPFFGRLVARTGRIGFVILRTGCSPPVALHPASRRRSYLRL